MGEQVNRIGMRLGTYHLLRVLGEGGYAQVYLAAHVALGTPAAIKGLRTRMPTSDVEELRTETRTRARLAHPHICASLNLRLRRTRLFWLWMTRWQEL